MSCLPISIWLHRSVTIKGHDRRQKEWQHTNVYRFIERDLRILTHDAGYSVQERGSQEQACKVIDFDLVSPSNNVLLIHALVMVSSRDSTSCGVNSCDTNVVGHTL